MLISASVTIIGVSRLISDESGVRYSRLTRLSAERKQAGLAMPLATVNISRDGKTWTPFDLSGNFDKLQQSEIYV